jgi:hypothetical protein
MSYIDKDQCISLEEASALTKVYREANPNAIRNEVFGKEILQAILNQADCVGVRLYYGGSDGTDIVVCGIYDNGNDIYNGVLGDRAIKNSTGAANPLNSDI